MNWYFMILDPLFVLIDNAGVSLGFWNGSPNSIFFKKKKSSPTM